MSVDVITELDNFSRIVKGLDFIKNNELYVGIPEDETDRQDSSEVTNAELLFIHTNGSPANNIPPRPVIEPVVRNNANEISRKLSRIFNLACDGKTTDAENQLNLVGEWVVGRIRRWFVDPANGWPPNVPSVQKAKMKKGSTNPRPLIDTGELRKSITYVLMKGRRK